MGLVGRHECAASDLLDPSAFPEASNDKMSEVRSLIVI